MYGLKQAAILAYDQLCSHLKQYGYNHVPGTTGVFNHVSRRTKFCLCVDGFGIKYYSKDDATTTYIHLFLPYMVSLLIGKEKTFVV